MALLQLCLSPGAHLCTAKHTWATSQPGSINDAVAMQAAANDADEEELWAAEQIRKGMGAKDAAALAAARNRNAAGGGATYSQEPAAAVGMGQASLEAAVGQTWGFNAAMSAASFSGRFSQPDQIANAGADVVKALQQGVAHMQVSTSIRLECS